MWLSYPCSYIMNKSLPAGKNKLQTSEDWRYKYQQKTNSAHDLKFYCKRIEIIERDFDSFLTSSIPDGVKIFKKDGKMSLKTNLPMMWIKSVSLCHWANHVCVCSCAIQFRGHQAYCLFVPLSQPCLCLFLCYTIQGPSSIPKFSVPLCSSASQLEKAYNSWLKIQQTQKCTKILYN